MFRRPSNEAQQQSNEGGFSDTRWARERDDIPFAYRDTDILQNRMRFIIGKADIFEGNLCDVGGDGLWVGGHRDIGVRLQEKVNPFKADELGL